MKFAASGGASLAIETAAYPFSRLREKAALETASDEDRRERRQNGSRSFVAGVLANV
jgi:hypothetical protein